MRSLIKWFVGLAALLKMSCVSVSDRASSLDHLTDGSASSAYFSSMAKLHGPRTHYVLKVHPPVSALAPLPSRSTIDVIWHYEDGYEDVVPGFMGWDFDRDGRFEMLDILDASGAVIQRVFDFDDDGQIDQSQSMKPHGKGSATGLSP